MGNSRKNSEGNRVPSPERRNFILFSLVIIVYCLADARLKNESFRILGLNLEINNLKILALVFVFVYLYLALRFWQCNQGLLKLEFKKFVRANSGRKLGDKIIKMYLVKTSLVKPDRVLPGPQLGWNQNKLGYNLSPAQGNPKNSYFKGFWGMIAILRISLSFLWRSPGPTDYALPWVLSGLAVLLGILKFCLGWTF